MGLLRSGLSATMVALWLALAVSVDAHAERTSIEDFARSPRFQHFSISPDGEQLLYQERDGDQRFLVVSRISEVGLTPVLRQPIGSDIYVSGAFWISNDKLFGYDARYRGALPTVEEEPHVTAWVMTANGENRKVLWEEAPAPQKKRKKGRKRKPTHKVTFGLLHSLPDDPDHVLLNRIEETPERRDDNELDVVSDIFRMNINTGEMSRITPDHGIEGARMFRWVPDHTGVIRIGFGETGEDDEPVLLVRKDATSDWTRLHDNDLFGRGKFYPIGFGSDPDILYVSSSLATGRDAIYRFSIKQGRLKGKVFAHAEVDAEALFVSPDYERIVAVSYYDDEYRLAILDESFRERHARIAKAIGTDKIFLGETDKAYSRQLVWAGDERSMGRAWIYFEASGKALPLPDPAPWIDEEASAPVTSVRYRARDGLEIPAYLTLPKGREKGEKLPAILLPHGGPYVRDYKTWNYWAQFLASRGYAVLQPNFRGSSGFGFRFSAMGFGQWGDDMQQDVADGAKWLISEGIAAPGRICIIGGSYGGYATLMGLVQDSDLFRCGVAWAPVTDLKKILQQDNMWDEDYAWYWRVTGGRSSKELKEISPVYLTEKITRPLLLMHGDEDDIVFIDQSRMLEKAMQKRKVSAPFRYLEFPGLGHQIETPEARERFLREMESFLLTHNPPGQPDSSQSNKSDGGHR